jgi:magnesium-transporting ATPase (P-type)
MLFMGKDIFGFTYDSSLTGMTSFFNAEGVATEKCVHYTLIFNTFVFCQVFNEINSRKLGEKEYNVFTGFFSNWLFIVIILGTIVVQYILVQYGGPPIRSAPLTLEQHAICIAIGLFSFIQSILVKLLLPVSWFANWQMKE